MVCKLPDFTGTIIDADISLDGHRECITDLEILNLIESGSNGAVYSAVNLSSSTSRYFAIKCTAAPTMGRSTFIQRLKNECALHERVSRHRNIVDFYDAREDHDIYFLVLDFIPGGDLFDAIAKRRIFWREDDRVRALFIQLLDAVQFCHENNVYHRDLKPENVLLTQNGSQLYLADFGLATSATESDEFNVGTLNYMSPECLNINHSIRPFATAPDDVWALGVILCFMLTGCLPWVRASPSHGLFEQYLLRPGSFFRRTLPVSWAANHILRRVLRVAPAQRVDLAELRTLVESCTNFFMEDEALGVATANVQAIAREYAIRPDRSPTPAMNPDVVPRSKNTFGSESFMHGSTDELDSDDSDYSDTDSDEDMDREDDGPITPPTLPVKLEAEVPELLEGLGKAVISFQKQLSHRSTRVDSS